MSSTLQIILQLRSCRVKNSNPIKCNESAVTPQDSELLRHHEGELPREPEEGVKGGKGRGEEGSRRKRSALELMQDLEAQKDVDETSSFRNTTPKQQADALIASFSGAIQELAAQRDQDELLEHFQKPCPTEAEEVLAFAGRCEQILLKAGKASKKRKGDQLYT